MVIDETELEGLTEDQRDAYIADLLEKEKAAEKQAAPACSSAGEALPWEREDAPGRDYQSTWNQF